MNNWQAYYDFEKKKESNRQELSKKRIIFLGVFALTLAVVSLLLAVFSSAAMAKLLFAAVFQDEGVSGGLVFLFLCGITCYIYYIYYAFMNCNALVAVLSSFGAILAKSLAAAAVYTYTGGAFTIPLFGMQIVPV